jgi:pyruvate,water dikinase
VFVCPLDHAAPLPRSLVGGKAENLMTLVRAGFAVPDGFVVTTEAFRTALRGRLAGRNTREEMHRRIVELEVPEPILREVERAYAQLLKRGWDAVAVRSSAGDEDSVVQSWAGQQDTYLNVRGFDSLLRHLKLCWASLFGESSLTYRARQGFADAEAAMAVVVQAMVQAETAGVSFSVNPVNGRRDQVLHTSAFGLGETVVSGGEVDTFVADKTGGALLEQRIGAKREMRVAGERGGSVVAPVPPGRAGKASLTEAQVAELTALIRRVEEHFGGAPQDVEWALREGRVYLLQARPVTAGKGLGPARRRADVSVWTNANVGEALPGVGTPFTWSIIGRFARTGFEHAFAALGLDTPAGSLVRNFYGRVYLDQTGLMETLSQIPFFSPERILPLAGGTPVSGMAYRRQNPLPFVARLPITLPRLAAKQVSVPLAASWWRRGVRRVVREVEAELARPLGRRALAALLERFTAEVFNPTGSLMLSAASNALSTYVGVGMLLSLFGGPELAGLETRLFSGLSRLKSAEPGLFLLRLARIARNQASLLQLLRGPLDADSVVARVRTDREFKEFRREFERFLEEHGHRAPREAEIATPRWGDRPGLVIDLLRAYLNAGEWSDPEEFSRERVRERRRAERQVLARVGQAGRLMFRVLLPWARDAARLREELRDLVVKTLAVYRQLGLACGRFLVADGLALQPEEAFFLTYEELVAYLPGRLDADLSLRIALRKGQFEIFCRMPDPPSTFTLRGGEIVGQPLEAPDGEGDRLQGVGGSPGRVTGRARVLRSMEELGRLGYGDVLVTTQTDVGWTPLFLVAGAVVTEMGGPLSHSCVVAREYGKPAVVNVKQATRRIPDGAAVTVDGDRGEVILHR